MIKPINPMIFIPNFDALYEATAYYIECMQGKKGYIDTQSSSSSTLYGFEFDEDENRGVEKKIYGVRARNVDEGKSPFQTRRIEVIMETEPISHNLVYTEDDFKDESNWKDIQYANVYYNHTLIEIADAIHFYAEKNLI